jgi:hypothetical protein
MAYSVLLCEQKPQGVRTMPIRQVAVPYRQGYNIGVSADLATGSPMGKAVDGVATKVQGAGAATVSFSVKRIQTTEELEEALDIDAEASYGCAAFGAGISARFSFAKNSKIQTSSLFMLVTAQVELAFESVDDPALTQDADNLLDRPDIFNLRYGNVFVRGVQRGGLFVGTLRVDTTSAQESTAISTELAGSYGLFSADAKAKFNSLQRKYNCSVYVDMYHEGGPVDLKINDITNPNDLLDNANRFLESFRTQPEDTVAKPYFVTLAPVSIARSVKLPPNTADVEHAQDVLVACTKARSRILDKLNLLEFVLANAEKFTFELGVGPRELAAVQANFEMDLDIVAQSASAAINSPVKAKMPGAFAIEKGKAYPNGILPENMPRPIAGKMTKVPNFSNCANWQQCVALAAQFGLVAQQQIATNVEPSTFKVLSFSPPFDYDVTEGAVVTITTQPAKINPRDWWVVRRYAHAARYRGLISRYHIGQ